MDRVEWIGGDEQTAALLLAKPADRRLPSLAPKRLEAQCQLQKFR
jgi:hypothetical protein